VTLLLALWLAQSGPIEVGIAALDKGEFAAAEREFEKAVAADAQDYSAHFYLALARTFLNKDDEAAKGFEKTLELKPGLFEAQVNLGLLHYRYRRYPQAIEQLRAAVDQRPNDVRGQFHLADCWRELKQWPQAEERYRKTLELDSGLAAAKLGLARVLAAQGKLDEAAPLFLAADAGLELAQVYEDSDKWEEAAALYEKAPRELPVLTRLANTYLKLKRFDRVEEIVVEALKSAPDDYDLRMTYGRLRRDKREFQAAAAQFAAALKAKPDDVPALNEIAGMLILLDDWNRALGALERLKAIGAETPGHLFFRAMIFDKNNQAKPALEAYRAFLAAAGGKYPDEEFKARQRARILENEAKRR